MDTTHGDTTARRPVHAPRSRSFEGLFGRMFRNLPPWEPKGSNDAEKIEAIARIAAEMASPGDDSTDGDGEIPAGYTYFGQFVDHDLTFDPRSSLQKSNDPDNLYNFRTPAFDLDCLYGRGRDDQPYLYEDDGSFRIDKNSAGEDDLPRHKGTALIGDKRNDANTLVSQLHLAFLRFHNAVLQRHDGDFEAAQRSVRWHYQWVVIHDWLERLCGEELVKELLAGDHPGAVRLRYYKYRDNPFVPVEFSGAAYRVGHTMIRNRYAINGLLRLQLFKPGDIVDPKTDFRGFKPLPPDWTIEWGRFFNFPSHSAMLQRSRRLDPFLSKSVVRLPRRVADPGDVLAPEPIARSLAMRNLLRGWRLSLPSGQAVAACMGVDKTKVPETPELPLWRYILEEAHRDQDGLRLGEVGARIVAETFIGILHGDPASFLRVAPTWKPELEPMGTDFEMRDIIRIAGQRIA